MKLQPGRRWQPPASGGMGLIVQRRKAGQAREQGAQMISDASLVGPARPMSSQRKVSATFTAHRSGSQTAGSSANMPRTADCLDLQHLLRATASSAMPRKPLSETPLNLGQEKDSGKDAGRSRHAPRRNGAAVGTEYSGKAHRGGAMFFQRSGRRATEEEMQQQAADRVVKQGRKQRQEDSRGSTDTTYSSKVFRAQR